MYVGMWVGGYVWYLELSREPRHVAQQTRWVIPREVAQENPRPPSILMKIDKPIVPHDRNMYAQF